jgi:hydroxymethylpyrimidine/phosphomethylpyrimidine kinase
MTHAVREAKMYLSQAIDISADVTAGKGHGSLNHLYNPQPLSAIKF